VLDRILVPLDGSAVAETALGFATLIPSHHVRLLRLVQPDQAAAGGLEGQVAEASVALEEAAEELRRHGRDAEVVVAHDDPASGILDAAADANLIVMTTRGTGAADRAVFGSVADRVAHHSPIPVLLLRGDSRPTTEPLVARIVVPLDGSEMSEAALRPAIDLSCDLGVPLHLVRVVESDPVRESVLGGPMVAPAAARATERAVAEAGRYLDARAQVARDRNCVAVTEARAGYPVTELIAAMKPGDLVVMASHGRGGLGRWLLGSVADRLIREAPAPVLLVPRRER
jgi:nucleotide-binding universal stress UspA family protein